MTFDDWISAVFLTRTVLTFESGPDRIELIDSRLDQCWIIRKDAGLKVLICDI